MNCQKPDNLTKLENVENWAKIRKYKKIVNSSSIKARKLKLKLYNRNKD